MYSRNPAIRAAQRRTELDQRAAREAARHIAALTDRPDHDDVDDIAVDLALRGWTRHAANLSKTELVAAIRVGTDCGIGTKALADLLCLHEREVQRLKAQVRHAAVGRVAA